jgi:cytochrome c oxidase assembly factor CtaG
MALMAVALLGPTGFYTDQLMVAHMAEHLLIADLAAPLLLVGIRTPVYLFIPPRWVLVTVARRRGLRRVLHSLRFPPVAIGLYVLVLYGWHLRPAFEATLRSDAVHALQHQSFIAASLLVWWSALEPERRRMPGHLWKIGHIFASRLAGGFLGMAFIASRSSYYPNAYGERPRRYGLTPLDDQQLAGGLMMSLDFLILVFALSLFFWRAAQDEDRNRAAQTRPDGAVAGVGRPASRV